MGQITALLGVCTTTIRRLEPLLGGVPRHGKRRMMVFSLETVEVIRNLLRLPARDRAASLRPKAQDEQPPQGNDRDAHAAGVARDGATEGAGPLSGTRA
jgi:hypothetical protein